MIDQGVELWGVLNLTGQRGVDPSTLSLLESSPRCEVVSNSSIIKLANECEGPHTEPRSLLWGALCPLRQM